MAEILENKIALLTFYFAPVLFTNWKSDFCSVDCPEILYTSIPTFLGIGEGISYTSVAMVKTVHTQCECFAKIKVSAWLSLTEHLLFPGMDLLVFLLLANQWMDALVFSVDFPPLCAALQKI